MDEISKGSGIVGPSESYQFQKYEPDENCEYPSKLTYGPTTIISLGPDDLRECELLDLIDYVDHRLKYLIYTYEEGCYEGDGECIGITDSKIYHWHLGHCSCYGPTDSGPDIMDIKFFKEAIQYVTGPIRYTDVLDATKEILEIE